MLPTTVLLFLFCFDQILASDNEEKSPIRRGRPQTPANIRSARPSVVWPDGWPGFGDEVSEDRFRYEGGLAAALEAAAEEGAAHLHVGGGRRPSVLDFGGEDDAPLPGLHRGGNLRPRLFAVGNEAEDGVVTAAAETDSGGESDASAEDFERPHRGDGAEEATTAARLREAFPPLLSLEELAALEASTLSAAGGFHPDDGVSAWASHALSAGDAERYPGWFAELVREGVVTSGGRGGQLPVPRARGLTPREARRSALVLSAMLSESRPRARLRGTLAEGAEGGALTELSRPPSLERHWGCDVYGNELGPPRGFVAPPPLPVAEVRTVDGGIAEVIARGDADEGARAVAAHARRSAPPEQAAWVLHPSPIRASRRPEGVRPHIPHLVLPAPAVDAAALAAPREQDGWEYDAATVGAAGATPQPVLEAGAEGGADDEAAHSARGLAWSIDALRRILRGGRDALYDASVSEFLGCCSSPPERLSCLHEILQMEVRMRERSVCSAQRAYEAERRRLLEAQRNTLSRLRLHIRLMQMEQREDVVIGNGYRPDYERACARYFSEAANLVERLRRRMRVLKIEVEMGELREVRARALYVKFRGEALAAVRNRARQTVLDLQLAEMERREDPRLAPLTHSASAVRLPRAPLLVSPMRVPAGGDTRVGFQ